MKLTRSQLESKIERLQKRYAIVCKWAGVSTKTADAMLDAQRVYCLPCNVYYDDDDCSHEHDKK